MYFVHVFSAQSDTYANQDVFTTVVLPIFGRSPPFQPKHLYLLQVDLKGSNVRKKRLYLLQVDWQESSACKKATMRTFIVTDSDWPGEKQSLPKALSSRFSVRSG